MSCLDITISTKSYNLFFGGNGSIVGVFLSKKWKKPIKPYHLYHLTKDDLSDILQLLTETNKKQEENGYYPSPYFSETQIDILRNMILLLEKEETADYIEKY